MEAGTSAPLGQGDSGYGGASVAGAVLATLCFPFVALVVALLLLGAQIEPRKRSQLRTWALVSGGWLAFWTLLVVLAFVSFRSGSGTIQISRAGPCQGGPQPGAPGRQIPGTNKFVFACAFGGTETTSMP